MSSEITLKIEIPEHYQIVYENSEEFEKSPFSEAYNKAHKLITEIVSKQEELIKLSQSQNCSKNLDSYNNIIAFTGERGMGKSSTMINFLNSLDAERSRPVLSPLHGRIQFIKLDVIDPSLFRGDESIFEIVLAQMFRKFKNILEQQVFQNKDEERRKLIFSFQKVYDTFRWTKKEHKDVYSEESIDNLIHLAKGSNLKASFNNLIQSFLSFTGGKGNNKLVVTIDDFDLKTNGIKEMLEDIRQLLINSNIVILIAYKEDQLRDLLQRNFSQEIENVSSRNFRLEIETIKIQVDKYLEKLLPNSHQIELLSSNHKEIKSYLKKVIELSPDDEQNENETNYRQSDKRLLAVSYLKQNLFIMLEDFFTSFLYKPNLRSLNELLISLDNEEIDLFTQYVQNLHYAKQHEKWIDRLWTCELELINKITLNYIVENFSDELNYRENQRYTKTTDNYLSDLLTTKNYHLIQFGDIAAIFKILNNRIDATIKEKFETLQFIRLCYNLRRLSLIETNTNFITKSSISGIISPILLNTNDRISKEEATGAYRDYFIVHFPLKDSFIDLNIQPIDQSRSKYYLQSFLIDTINKDVIKSNLNGKDNIYNFDVKEDGIKTENFTFNIYKPFNYSTLDLPNLEIIASSKKENHHKPKNKYYYLFQNTDFVLEFYEIFIKQLDLFSKNGKLRLSETKYPMVLYVLYTEGIQHTFTELNLKYPFLKLNYEDYIESNIFFKDFKSINDSLTSDGVAKKEKMIDVLHTYYLNQSTKKNTEVTKLQDLSSVSDIQSVKNIVEYLNKSRIVIAKLKKLFENVQDQNVKSILLKDEFINTLTNSNSQFKENRKKLQSDLELLIDSQASN